MEDLDLDFDNLFKEDVPSRVEVKLNPEPDAYNSFIDGVPLCQLSPRVIDGYFKLWRISYRHINSAQENYREKLQQALADYLSARHSTLLESKELKDDGSTRYNWDVFHLCAVCLNLKHSTETCNINVVTMNLETVNAFELTEFFDVLNQYCSDYSSGSLEIQIKSKSSDSKGLVVASFLASPTFMGSALSCEGNDFTEEELIAITAALKTNVSLKSAYFADSRMTPATISTLCDSLLYNKTLRRVRARPLDPSHLDINCLIDIRRTLEVNTNIELFTFVYDNGLNNIQTSYRRIVATINKAQEELSLQIVDRIMYLLHQNIRLIRTIDCAAATKLLCIVRMCAFNLPWQRVGNEIRMRKTVHLPLELWLHIFEAFGDLCEYSNIAIAKLIQYGLCKRTLVRSLTKRSFLNFTFESCENLEELLMYT
ncbi:3467_t:CDS:2 [Paraglomus brasilianum]|uniref:3467_t:CDS:1 n=1 Tax=Paraglomus brasilianum TaxID=144538 RepID=A0A9N8ZC20_9GLOM|nr:3467_t:CDS:2 [Paraglomus brasilianum]